MEVPPRQIIRSAKFEEELLELIPFAPDADEFTNAAEQTLSLDPESGVVA